MKKIKLTKGQFAKVDDEDFDKLNIYKWQAVFDKTTNSFYARGAKYLDGKQIHFSMHRVILGLKNGDGLKGDHINHDTLDNRKINLRIVNNNQSAMNKNLRKDSSTGYKGVYMIKENLLKKYRAKIRVDGKQIHLGCYETPEEAHDAYKKASVKYHGIFGVFK